METIAEGYPGTEIVMVESRYLYFSALNGVYRMQIHLEIVISSLPMIGVPFMINGSYKTTPYTETLPEDSYMLEMPQSFDAYVWSRWLEDGDTNRVKTITLEADPTWTGVYVAASPPAPPVGGEWAIIDKLQLLTTMVTLFSLVALSSMSFVCMKRYRNKQS